MVLYLMEPVAGHVMPLQHATYWLVAHHLPFDWPTISLMILGVQLASGVVAWHLLSRLLPDRWARVPLLALLMWAPLTLATTLWWSASMGLWPHVADGPGRDALPRPPAPGRRHPPGSTSACASSRARSVSPGTSARC